MNVSPISRGSADLLAVAPPAIIYSPFHLQQNAFLVERNGSHPFCLSRRENTLFSVLFRVVFWVEDVGSGGDGEGGFGGWG